MSKEELAQENDRITAEICRLKAGLGEMTVMFQNLEKAFVESKASFSLSRYGELKDMIKKITSDESMEKAQSLSENQSQERKGVSSLLEKAKHFAGDEAGGKDKDKDKGKDKGKGKEDDKSPPPKCGGKISGFFKKIKNATGFSDDPPDIRCLDKEDIRKDNERKQREVQRLNLRGLKAYNKLEQLQKRYQASKAQTPPSRYQELKDMIKEFLADGMP